MKINKVLSEQGGQVMLYHAEYSMNNGIGRIDSDSVESLQDGLDVAHDEFSIEAKQMFPGVWVGWSFGEAEISDDADEDGPYQYTELTGDLVIITNQQISPEHPIFKKVVRQMDMEADDEMSEAQYAHRDEQEYRRDPYAYYGVKRSDF